MTDTSADDVVRFQKRNRNFYWSATIIFFVMVAVIALTLLVVATRGAFMRVDTLQQLPLAWAPAIFYLWAVWAARSMFAAFSRGGFIFQDVVTKTLTRIGWALCLGAAATMLATPLRLLMGAHLVAGFAVLNIPALTLGVVGFALIAMARMMHHARGLETRLAKLDAELQDFV
jgi:hypothetical protein